MHPTLMAPTIQKNVYKAGGWMAVTEMKGKTLPPKSGGSGDPGEQELGKGCLGLRPPLSALADQLTHGLFFFFLSFFLNLYLVSCRTDRTFSKTKTNQSQCRRGFPVSPALSPQVAMGDGYGQVCLLAVILQDTDPLKGGRRENTMSLIISMGGTWQSEHGSAMT